MGRGMERDLFLSNATSTSSMLSLQTNKNGKQDGLFLPTVGTDVDMFVNCLLQSVKRVLFHMPKHPALYRAVINTRTHRA